MTKTKPPKYFLFVATLLSLIGYHLILRGEENPINATDQNLNQPSPTQAKILLATGLKIIVPSSSKLILQLP